MHWPDDPDACVFKAQPRHQYVWRDVRQDRSPAAYPISSQVNSQRSLAESHENGHGIQVPGSTSCVGGTGAKWAHVTFLCFGILIYIHIYILVQSSLEMSAVLGVDAKISENHQLRLAFCPVSGFDSPGPARTAMPSDDSPAVCCVWVYFLEGSTAAGRPWRAKAPLAPSACSGTAEFKFG